MVRFRLLLVVLFFLLLVAPAAPRAGATAAADVAPPTFNLRKIAAYPGASNQRVAVTYDRAYVTDGTNVSLYDITDPKQPLFKEKTNSAGVATMDIDAVGPKLARLVRDAGYGTFLIIYNTANWSLEPACSLWFPWSEDPWPHSVRLSDDGRYAYVGFYSRLWAVDVANAVNGECLTTTHFWNGTVNDIVQKGDKLYVAGGPVDQVVEFLLTDPAYPTIYNHHYTDGTVLSVAVADNADIFAGLYPHGLQIFRQDDTRTYLPDREVSVVAEGNRVYVGTDLDLQVLDATQLGPTLSADLPIIGRYSDSLERFYADLAAQNGLVHSINGIFQFDIDLLLRALSAGVTVNGRFLAAGASAAIGEGDHVGLSSPDGSATLYLRCTDREEETLADLRWTGRETIKPYALLGIASAVARFNERACNLAPLGAALSADLPALPLTLESGGLGADVVTTKGVIQVNTANASSQAGGGTSFEAGHDPDQSKSRFVCLAGTLQVQPTAAGAPLMTLGPGQFVDVTAAGAGPIGQYRYSYLPLLRR